MKGVVVYDTYYGNTKKVAEAIADQIRAEGHEADLRNVRENYPAPPQGDFLFVGSPNRMGSVTGGIKRFVKRLDLEAWKNKPMAVFTTVAPLPKEDATDKQKKGAEKWILGAATKLRDRAKARGLNVVDKVLYVEVLEAKGPVVDSGIEQTKQFARDFIQTMKK